LADALKNNDSETQASPPTGIISPSVLEDHFAQPTDSEDHFKGGLHGLVFHDEASSAFSAKFHRRTQN
jgi:hypothetical protein